MQQGWGPAMQAPMTAVGGAQIQQQSAAAQIQQYAPPVKKPKRRVLTSLTLEIFVYFGGWWDVFYYVVNILVFVWKGDIGVVVMHGGHISIFLPRLACCSRHADKIVAMGQSALNHRAQPSLSESQLCNGIFFFLALVPHRDPSSISQ